MLNCIIVLELRQISLLMEWTHQILLNKGPVLALTHLLGGTYQQICAEANGLASTALTTARLICWLQVLM